MVELIRKLTANYDEKEYRDWLQENNVDFKDDLDEGESRFDFYELKAPDGTYIFINKSLYRKIDARDILALDGSEDFKDMDIMIEEIALQTGYDKRFLSKIFDEIIKEGCESFEEAFDHVACVSHEMDW